MTTKAIETLESALRLPAMERAAIADELISSLDQPDESIDALWIKESEDRVAAFERGEIKAISEEEMFARLEKL